MPTHGIEGGGLQGGGSGAVPTQVKQVAGRIGPNGKLRIVETCLVFQVGGQVGSNALDILWCQRVVVQAEIGQGCSQRGVGELTATYVVEQWFDVVGCYAELVAFGHYFAIYEDLYRAAVERDRHVGPFAQREGGCFKDFFCTAIFYGKAEFVVVRLGGEEEVLVGAVAKVENALPHGVAIESNPGGYRKFVVVYDGGRKLNEACASVQAQGLGIGLSHHISNAAVAGTMV